MWNVTQKTDLLLSNFTKVLLEISPTSIKSKFLSTFPPFVVFMAAKAQVAIALWFYRLDRIKSLATISMDVHTKSFVVNTQKGSRVVGSAKARKDFLITPAVAKFMQEKCNFAEVN